MKFLVSVIIPVYNGERFIEKAIHSALQQSEVIEVIIVEDGSTDKTLEIVELLKSKNSKINIFHHANKINKGRSSSRNLGIKKASGNFIAFLDADDFYLKNRFKKDEKIFKENNDVDGVYNAIGAYFYREASVEENDKLELFTIRKEIHSENLFENLLTGKHGHFSIDGLTVKKSIFEVTGYFNEKLVVAEDTELIFKMSLKSKLVSGNIIKPVALRGLHDNNVFNTEALYDVYFPKMYETLASWSAHNKISQLNIDKILNWLWLLRYKTNKSIFKHTIFWINFVLGNPRMLFSKLSIKYFPLVRLRQKLFPFMFRK
jgi:glycosyltransferase involved in cell wall biosynthesis